MEAINPEIDYFILSIQARRVFTPTTPISEKTLFLGRKDQIRRVIDVIFQQGQHAIIFGDRGIGKTSLANVLQDFLPTPKDVSSTRINCDRADTFTTVWQKVLTGMHLSLPENGMGFQSSPQAIPITASHFIVSEDNVPEQVRQVLLQISKAFLTTIVIIDEFDRLEEPVRRLFADLIKSLSDYSIDVTIILIGVGESIEHLINEHQSVSRALVQIQLPRMQPSEIEEIIRNGIERLNMTIEDATVEKIKLLSKGLPHYTHLICLHTTRSALDNHSLHVDNSNLENAINQAIEDAQHSIKTNYYNAIRSTKKDNLFADVLLACALAETNEMGEFAAQDLRDPMQKITGRAYNIPAFAQHLNEFSESKRGKILTKSGQRKRYRYKFSDPLMQPFIIMQGIANGKNC